MKKKTGIQFCNHMVALFLTVLLAGVSGCRHEPSVAPAAPSDGNFPPAVASIFLNKCATSGCHNSLSYQNANGLRLDNWDGLFDGGNNGASLLAHDPANSSLLYFVNTDPSRGLVGVPLMPLNRPALSDAEYFTLRDWIAAGAPDKNGTLPFSANADTRQKIYVTQQGCDLVAVVDAERSVVIKYIPVGESPAIESPHCIRVSPDGRYAYVSCSAGSFVQKIDTRTDTVVAELDLGPGSWNVLTVSSNGAYLMISNWQGNGSMALVDAGSMKLISNFSSGSLFTYPHGVAATPNFDTFYITAQYGNFVYKFVPASGQPPKRVSLDGNPISAAVGLRDPHEIVLSADGSRYFVSCQASNEVRVMDARADTLIRSIPVGTYPQELVLAPSKKMLFVTCREDSSSGGFKGSCYAIDLHSLSTVNVIKGPFYQPHGLAVDEPNSKLYVVSINDNPNGPASHHATACSPRNGWYNVYDLNSLQLVSTRRYQLTNAPYSADSRFK